MFSTVPYLEWIEGRPARADYDLGSSDLRQHDPRGDVVPEPLVGLDDPDAETTLRTQLAALYDVPETSVLVAAGATHANLLAAATALGLSKEKRDGSDAAASGSTQRVLVEKPGYEPLVETPESLGARVDRFVRPAESGYPLEAARVSAAADDVALVTVTNRHNPSGRLTDRETLGEVAAAASEAGGYLLVDEVYAPFVADAATERAFGGVTAAGLPDTVVTGSLTKFHGLGGLRIGWLVGPEAFVERAETVAAHIPAVAEPSVALGRRALANETQLTDASRERLRANHDRLTTFVDGRDDLSGNVYDGSTFAFLAHERADGSAVSEAAWEHGLLVVPGHFFDQTGSFRLSLGRHPRDVEAGLDVLGTVLDDL